MSEVHVANDFDYKAFARDNGFFHIYLDAPQNAEKYGGYGFVVYKNFDDSSDMPYHLKKRLEITFVNELPISYKII